jgi:hypothetical protein
MSNFVYELEKGWSFDGYYIPHFLELNWYWGDNPVDYHGLQKIRIHGLAKGRALLEVSVNGLQTDYMEDYSEAQWIDLPYHVSYITSEFSPVTNYVDTASRGLSTQLKFEGRNTDITQPEPAHVIQVLVLQGSPEGTGKRSN